jgi:predicted nucleic acid-binding protein
MVNRVLDTSVVAKWFFTEEGTGQAEVYLEEMLRGEARVVVPSALIYELGNLFWTRRRFGLQEAEAGALWAEVESLPWTVADAHRLMPRALRFAYRFEVSPYDAVFAVLAEEVEGDLITADLALLDRLAGRCDWVHRL